LRLGKIRNQGDPPWVKRSRIQSEKAMRGVGGTLKKITYILEKDCYYKLQDETSSPMVGRMKEQISEQKVQEG